MYFAWWLPEQARGGDLWEKLPMNLHLLPDCCCAIIMPLSVKDESLIRLFMTPCCNQWDKLPGLGKLCLEAGSSAAELQGCVRHIAM